MSVAAATALALLLGACAGPGPLTDDAGRSVEDLVSDRAPTALDADWNDIDAAVAAAASEVEMALVRTNERPGWGGSGGHQSRRVFRLKTIRDETAWLLVERPPGSAASGDAAIFPEHEHLMTAISLQRPGATAEPQQLVMRARIGRHGDVERERALLRAVADRLRALRGRAWAPLD